jgi:isopenicillin N synthase-like dioxygenase
MQLCQKVIFFLNVDFPSWSKKMDHWGNSMLSSVQVLSQMVAIGFGLPKDAFISRIQNGPHLLAPTV